MTNKARIEQLERQIKDAKRERAVFRRQIDNLHIALRNMRRGRSNDM